MTKFKRYKIYAFTVPTSLPLVSITTTDNEAVAEMVVNYFNELGYIVRAESE